VSQNVIDMSSRVENYFPERTGSGPPVLLIGPATDSPVPPLDLLKLSTFLHKRGYSPSLHRGVLDKTIPEPHAVILTSVFSWEVPGPAPAHRQRQRVLAPGKNNIDGRLAEETR
jgi:hypothetical protein